MTPEKHKERHVELHKWLDELFADYIKHHPEQHGFLDMPFKQFLDWSHQQTIKPDEPTD
jgi:hypothetical protein